MLDLLEELLWPHGDDHPIELPEDDGSHPDADR